MKTPLKPQSSYTALITLATLAILMAAFMAAIGTVSAQTLFYSNSTNTGWGTTQWNTTGVGDAGSINWTDGNVAVFGFASNTTVANAATRTVNGLSNTGAGAVTIGTGGSIVFNPGSVVTSTGANFVIQGNISGSFEKTGAGTVNLGVTGATAYNGTATATGGVVTFGGPARTSTSSNAVVNGGTVAFNSSPASYTFGSISGSSGTLQLSQTNDGIGAANVTVSSLSSTGSGFTIATNNSPNAAAVSNLPSLTVNQAGTTTFTGTINGANTNNNGTRTRLSFTKAGVGDLTMTGAINDLERTTNINGGRLIINSTTTDFGQFDGTTAISVNNGGTLGGTGVITTTAGDNVVVAAGGKLEPGLDNAAGVLTMALGTGAELNLIAAATSSTAWLRFDLGDNSLAGTSYDQILLSSGTLNIGSGLLGFEDFAFNPLTGFGPAGIYTLFTGGTLTGTLSGSVSGEISPGVTGTLSISGNSILLEVIPEPSVMALLISAIGVLAIVRRRRQA